MSTIGIKRELAIISFYIHGTEQRLESYLKLSAPEVMEEAELVLPEVVVMLLDWAMAVEPAVEEAEVVPEIATLTELEDVIDVEGAELALVVVLVFVADWGVMVIFMPPEVVVVLGNWLVVVAITPDMLDIVED